jgi:YidC/Oxa1 family membrane protein insertase
MDPAKGYNLLVAISTQGASVEHAELVGQTGPGKFLYRALEHDGGYLGYLGLVPTTQGLRVRTVPDGSPAQRAVSEDGSKGIVVGDVLTELNGVSLRSLGELERVLSQTRPGGTAELAVARSVAGDAKTLHYVVTLSEAPLDILRLEPGNSEEVDGNLERRSLLTTLGSLGGTRIPLGAPALPQLLETLAWDWEVRPLQVPGGEGVEFRLPLDGFLAASGQGGALDLVKRYRLLPPGDASDGYLLDLETVIVNRQEEAVDVSFRQEGLSGLTLEGWWYSVKISPYMFAGAGQRDVVYNTASAGHRLATTRQIVDRARETLPESFVAPAGGAVLEPNGLPIVLLSENEPSDARSLKYIGLDSQYFNASILPHKQSPDSLSNLRGAGAMTLAQPADLAKAQTQAANVSFWLDTEEQPVPAGGELSQRYSIYIGPKATDALAAHGLERAIEYGWFPWIAKPLSGILHFFHFIVRNYGLAIVMLTIMVRALMFPLGRKAAMNAQRMQELQPELKRINDLYKDNMEKRAKAMQELYAKHNFKPLAGCLPMFIQLPIFIGLYRCLSVDISLRQEPLIPGISWASNLAAPDQLINWSSWMPDFIAGRGVGWLGPYFNILPMVTVGLFLLQQKILMPKATDEQTRMTQNMMQVMTVFMGVLFFKVPSGLCIYFITSSIWSLIERRLVKRLTPPSVGGASGGPGDKTPGTPPDTPTRSDRKKRRANEPPAEVKPPSRLQELRQMLDKPAVRSGTQRGPGKPPRKDKKRRD